MGTYGVFPKVFMGPGEFQISAGYANNVKYCQELRICLSPPAIGVNSKNNRFSQDLVDQDRTT